MKGEDGGKVKLLGLKLNLLCSEMQLIHAYACLCDL